MRLLGFVLISILSTQVLADSFEDRIAFRCKDEYLHMAQKIGYKSPALLFRAEDGTYFSTYEKLAAHLESNKNYKSYPFQKAKITSTSFLVYDQATVSEREIKEVSLVKVESLKKAQSTAEDELMSLTRIYSDEKNDRLRGYKPKKRDVPLLTQMRKKKEEIAALGAELAQAQGALPKHLLIKDAYITTVAITEAKTSHELNLTEKCEVAKSEGSTTPCEGAQASELCGAYTNLLTYNKLIKDRAPSYMRSKTAPPVKHQN